MCWAVVQENEHIRDRGGQRCDTRRVVSCRDEMQRKEILRTIHDPPTNFTYNLLLLPDYQLQHQT